MQFLDRLIGRQIRKPSGILGCLLGHIMAAHHKALTEWTIGQLQVQDHNYVLDIGCGSGLAIRMINAVVTHTYIVGIDYSPLMLRQAAKRNNLAIQKGKTALCHGSVSALPFANASFDKVCAIEAFYFWPNPYKNLQEVKRVLKSGGTAVFSMEISKEGTNRSEILRTARKLGFPIYSGEEMTSLLLAAGFIDVDYKTISDREKGWLCSTGSIQN